MTRFALVKHFDCIIITVVKCGEKSQRYGVIYKNTSR
jgi:hypothetical protein